MIGFSERHVEGNVGPVELEEPSPGQRKAAAATSYEEGCYGEAAAQLSPLGTEPSSSHRAPGTGAGNVANSPGWSSA